jgi:hypothetical protein
MRRDESTFKVRVNPILRLVILKSRPKTRLRERVARTASVEQRTTANGMGDVNERRPYGKRVTIDNEKDIISIERGEEA